MKDDFINEIYNWFIEKKKKLLDTAIIIIALCPLVIWLVYLFGNSIWGFPTDLSADGILSYLAAIISSIATIFLGFITLALSNRANKINDELLGIQKNQYLLETQPFIMITHWEASGKRYMDIVQNPDKIYLCIDILNKNQTEVSCLSLFLTNTTKSFLTANYISGSIIKNGERYPFALGAANQFNTKLLLAPGTTMELVLYGKSGFFNNLVGNEVSFVFNLENRLAEPYLEEIKIIIVMYSDPFEQGIENWYTMLAVKNYEVTNVR